MPQPYPAAHSHLKLRVTPGEGRYDHFLLVLSSWGSRGSSHPAGGVAPKENLGKGVEAGRMDGAPGEQRPALRPSKAGKAGCEGKEFEQSAPAGCFEAKTRYPAG